MSRSGCLGVEVPSKLFGGIHMESHGDCSGAGHAKIKLFGGRVDQIRLFGGSDA